MECITTQLLLVRSKTLTRHTILLAGFIGFLVPNGLFSQIDSAYLDLFREYEDSMAKIALTIGTDTSSEAREQAVHEFIPYLVQALKTPTSFHYPFTEVLGVSFQYAPDRAFRAITFQLRKADGTHRYFGALQINSGERLSLIPLIDMSDTLEFHTQEMLTSDNWYGAVYYRIMVKEVGGVPYYTLLGFDANDLWSNRKIIELLHFEDGRPVFGAPLISITDSLGNTTVQNRFFLEFKHDTKVSMNYDSEKDMIVYDHLVPYEPQYEGLYFTYIPDGTYEGFEFRDEKWRWVKKIFHFAINERDNPPMPRPLFEDKQKESNTGQN